MRIQEGNWMKSGIILFIPLILLLNSPLLSQEISLTLKKIKEHEKQILNASKLFGINPVYLKAIILTERTLNYNWEIKLFSR